MKKITVLSGCMLLIILASCAPSNDEVSINTENTIETSTPIDTSIAASEDTPIVLAQWFVEYDSSYIGETQDTVLFFHAEWCGSCKNTEASLIETWVPADLTVLKVDFDAPKNLELRQKYGVTTKHTFVQIDANWELIKKWEWSANLADIQESMEKTMNSSDDVMMKKSEDEAMMKKDESMDKMEKEAMLQEETMMKKEDTSLEGQEVMTKELAWVYANYDSSLVGATDDTVLFFHASWCPSCVAANKGISAGTVPEGLTILKADFDSETELRKQYWVTGQHTFVQVDANGNEIKKWVGGNSVEDIVERVQ